MNSRVLPIFAIAIALAIFIGYVNPTWTGSIAQARAAIAADDQALTAAQQYITQENQLAAARNAIDPTALSALSVFLPDSVNNVGIILDLNALAARTGLSIVNADVMSNDNTSSGSGSTPSAIGGIQTTAQNPVGSVDLSLSAIGTFSALQAFLVGIEHSERLLDMQELTVRGSDTGVYTYQMKIRLYWLR